ncbi:hypothetical protein WNB94_15995 [Aquabacterium sp. A3]|uniref:hypothetical protein n=1 Tax=Aquabacterium sp. A3 TaxID=3132829 RepID=UPI00311A7493
MDDQRLIPDAFLAVYRDARGRLLIRHEELLARHECCEDLCQALLEQVRWLPSEHGVPAGELAERVLGSVQNPLLLRDVERPWAIGRLTELLNGPSFA